ncbi:MAG: DUF3592 domain-containing protein [Verrucomicrobiales bacterium]|nr:DUF3592 domain-containing protein [Verrucomicrobiales bacterium]
MKFVYIGFLAVTLVTPAVWGFREARRLSRTKFSRTQGTITYSGIASGESMIIEGNEVQTFAPDVRYAFSVGVDGFEGGNLSYMKKESSRRADIERAVSSFQAGDIVSVYFDPNDFSSCYLSNPAKFVWFHLTWSTASILIFLGLSTAIWIVL